MASAEWPSREKRVHRTEGEWPAGHRGNVTVVVSQQPGLAWFLKMCSPEDSYVILRSD